MVAVGGKPPTALLSLCGLDAVLDPDQNRLRFCGSDYALYGLLMGGGFQV
jgi:hypothetical protein